MVKKIRYYFATGLLVSLPVFITVFFLYIVLRFIDNVFGKLINLYLQKNFGFMIPGIGILIGLVIVVFVGFLAANFFGNRLIRALERWFMKFPFVKQVYPAAKQVVDSLISKDSPAFKKVVLIEYPSKGIWSVGFLTSDSFEDAKKKTGKDLVVVFIANTPSPFTGFIVLVPRDEIKVMDMSIEDGIKLVVSGGIVKPK